MNIVACPACGNTGDAVGNTCPRCQGTFASVDSADVITLLVASIDAANVNESAAYADAQDLRTKLAAVSVINQGDIVPAN